MKKLAKVLVLAIAVALSGAISAQILVSMNTFVNDLSIAYVAQFIELYTLAVALIYGIAIFRK